MALEYRDKRPFYRGLNPTDFPNAKARWDNVNQSQPSVTMARREPTAPRDAFRVKTKELTAEEQLALLEPAPIAKPAFDHVPDASDWTLD
jgi:hypothetical protein